MGDVVDINMCAVHDVMEDCNVVNKEDCMDKVVYAFRKIRLLSVEE